MATELRVRGQRAGRGVAARRVATRRVVGAGCPRRTRSRPGAVAQRQRHAGVEAHVRSADHQRIVGEPDIGERIGDLHHVAAVNRMGTDRHVARGFGGFHAVVRLEPLAVRVHQAHERNGHVERRTDLVGVPIETFLGLGVEDPERMQRRDASVLVDGERCVLPPARTPQQPGPQLRSQEEAARRPDDPLGDSRLAHVGPPSGRRTTDDDHRHLAAVRGVSSRTAVTRSKPPSSSTASISTIPGRVSLIARNAARRSVVTTTSSCSA